MDQASNRDLSIDYRYLYRCSVILSTTVQYIKSDQMMPSNSNDYLRSSKAFSVKNLTVHSYVLNLNYQKPIVTGSFVTNHSDVVTVSNYINILYIAFSTLYKYSNCL